MATNVLLPQWGMEMAEGTIVKWLKQEGDSIEEGELLVAVETAKLETEMESIASGIVAHILIPEGATVPIRTVLAVIAEPGEDVPRPETVPLSPSLGTAVAAPPSQPTARAVAAPRSGGAGDGRLNVQVVPAARRLAQQNGIDLAEVQGTGPSGRILIADVERAIEAQAQPTPQVVPLQGIRRTIATRMMQSLQTMAQVTLTTEADVTDAMTLREGLNRQTDRANLSPLHLAVKAAARALKEHPRLNAVQEEDQYRLMDQVNIGVAVSLAEGLITAVIKDADAKGLDQLASESREVGPQDPRRSRHPRRRYRRHLHHHQLGSLRRRRFHAHHQPAAGGDPGLGARGGEACSAQWAACRRQNDVPQPDLRPPHRGRRARGRVSASNKGPS